MKELTTVGAATAIRRSDLGGREQGKIREPRKLVYELSAKYWRWFEIWLTYGKKRR